MTIDELVNEALKGAQVASDRAAALIGAMRAAAAGKPIFLPDGQPVPNLRRPALGDVLVAVLDAERALLAQITVLLQIAAHTARMLSGGFALSDQEAARIADLLLDRLNPALDSVQAVGLGVEHEVTGPDMPAEPQGD